MSFKSKESVPYHRGHYHFKTITVGIQVDMLVTACHFKTGSRWNQWPMDMQKSWKIFNIQGRILHKAHLVASTGLMSPPSKRAHRYTHSHAHTHTHAKQNWCWTSAKRDEPGCFFSPAAIHKDTHTHRHTHQRFPSHKPQCGNKCHNQTTNVTCCTHNNVGMQLNTIRAQHRASGNNQS